MRKSKIILFVALLISSLASIGLVSNSVSAAQSDFRGYESSFGPLVGLSVNDTKNVDWLMSGTWQSILTSNPNENVTLYNQGPGPFSASIEMIRPDGSDRHTHALTHVVVTNITQIVENNSTLINGTSTISMMGGPAVDIPITIERSSDGSVCAIMIDPASVDYHFGRSPFIYGIKTNHESMKAQHATP